MTLKQEALEFTERLKTLYFEQRNMGALLPAMSEDTSWIGTGAMELCRNLDDAKAALALEGQEYLGSFTVTETRWDVTCLAENVCVIYGEISAKSNNPKIADLYNRVTAVCTRTSEGMKLSHLHLSCPDVDQEDGSLYVKRNDAQQRETLLLRAKKATADLHDHAKKLEALTENIPGGVHQCTCDDEMTFLSMSHSFLTLVGYSTMEIKERFHNHFAEMIYPPDLKELKSKMAAQLSHGNILELEYRILHKDGTLLWILDQGKQVVLEDGSTCFYCILMDITKQKEEREELRLTLERHEIIMDQTTDIIFEWNLEKDTLTFSPNWIKKFGYEPMGDDISHKMPFSSNIHPEDMPRLTKLMHDSAAGIPYSETEFRIKDTLGNYTWNRIRATVQQDMQGKPIKVAGIILDIDVDKKQKERLLDQAQRDPLTNLYNKTALHELAVDKMEKNIGKSNQALLIIDIDNFKQVNDTYGHLCGDSLLSDVASVLRNNFRSSDLVGRIGGDEFLVFLTEIKSKKEVTAKTKALLENLRKLSPQKGTPPISCSIGIAHFPQENSDYFSLYKCADIALYQMKSRGKDGFLFYDAANCENDLLCSLAESAVGIMDSELVGIGDAGGGKLAQYTFKMLYDSIDVNTAVANLLEIVGRAYDVSRVYIFESSVDGLMCSNTFEWCNTDVSPEIDNLQNFRYKEDLDDYLKNFHDNIFYCKNIDDLSTNLHDILAPQGICSLLQCAIMDNGVFKGYVGFDECRENRNWTESQTQSLTLIANILSTFLLKLRLQEQLTSNQED